MAFIYDKATLSPGKLDLLNEWLPQQSWFTGAGPVTKLATYRFDDPDGEVGIETFLLEAGDVVLHLPVTYRGAPLDGADDQLIGTMQHSDLGTRYAYDAVADPVWASALVTAVLTGGAQAEQYVEVDGQLRTTGSTAFASGSGSAGATVDPISTVTVSSSGSPAVLDAGPYRITFARLAGSPLTSGTATLTVTWPGAPPTALATVAPRQ